MRTKHVLNDYDDISVTKYISGFLSFFFRFDNVIERKLKTTYLAKTSYLVIFHEYHLQ